ncbi:Imidazolonepropionase-like amidohydrolase [Actinacidiphila cocklensis]|uniref:Imidazolonepropionase-like amidohydrolase n=1 Tax=Actinacidiphila cocklensis TaxID=887465 RepID=A0A9W4DI43_9ACTN|nr:Imidazolonepropionase-like amidohydrolase [Actinacidiphila cocklensis]
MLSILPPAADGRPGRTRGAAVTDAVLLLRGSVVPVASPPIADGAVIVEDGLVSYVGPVSRAPRLSRDVTEVEVGEGTIIPGLIDAHVHLVADGGPDFAGEVAGASPQHLALKAYANTARSLRHGITAVRDLGAPAHAAIAAGREIANGRLVGAEVAAAGRAITAPGGHISYLGVEARGEAQMAEAARQELRQGAAGIKLVATGGVLTPGVAPGKAPFDEAELAAAVAVARAAGTWVAAHAIGSEGAKRALRAGATTIEHGSYLDREAIDLMASTGAVLVSTRIAQVRILQNKEHIEDSAVRRAEEVYAANIESVRHAARAGIPIAAASDAGTPFNPHGSVAEEGALLVDDIGLSNEIALQAVTRTAARCLCRPDLGHLSPGAMGHVVVTTGNPLDDIRALAHVKTVIAAGRPVRTLLG